MLVASSAAVGIVMATALPVKILQAMSVSGQMEMQGSYQEAQIQPEIVTPQNATPAEAISGVNINLGMGNNEPIIAVDPNNPQRIAVATYLGIRVSTDGGVTFQPRVTVTAPSGFSTASGGDSSLGYDSQGRLFWTFLLREVTGGWDVFIAQCNPTTGAILAGYPVNLSASAGVPNDNSTHSHDKEWLAIDSFAGSPYQDRLYVVWTDFQPGGSTILTSFSSDQGQNWSAAVTLSAAGEGFVWPSENTVAPNGDVYVAYHSQPTYVNNNPDGTSGRIYVLRSVNGGTSYPQKNQAYTAGQADLTFNRQSGTRIIPGTQFWLQGSVQPRILADPIAPGRIYVVANDQASVADFADVFIVGSVDNGLTWSAPAQLSGGAVGTIQVMPSAAIDPVTGCITVTYYDNRNGNTNSGGNFLLDVFATTSADGGVTFSPEFQINTAAFDPDLNAPCRFGPSGCGTVDTVRTLRIGEYNGLAMGGGVAFHVWTGNNASGFQDTFFEQFSGCTACTINCVDITQSNDAGQCGAVVNYSIPTTTGGCGTVTCDPPSGTYFPVGKTTVTCTSATGTSCTFDVTVKDTEPPQITCPADITVGNDPGLCSAVVTFAATATDNCPGVILVCSPPSGTVFPKGTTSVTCTATDTAGNQTSCSFTVTVNDVEPPTVACSVETPTLWPPHHNLLGVGLVASATDNCDGTLPVTVKVYSDEDELAPASGMFSPDAKDQATETLRLRAERRGDADGRVYLIVTSSTDSSGNTGHACCTVTVTHDQSTEAVAAVAAQAAEAEAYCNTHGGVPPAGYFEIGNGPEVGPKSLSPAGNPTPMLEPIVPAA